MNGITFFINLLHAFVVFGESFYSPLQLYSDNNLTDLILESSSPLTCNNIPGNSSIQVASLIAYSCWIVYSHPNCISTWSKKADDVKARLPSGSTWTIGSFHACNENVGGNKLNLDITEYFSPILPLKAPKILESYKDVCTCINVPDYVQELDKWSVNNYGNDLIAYFHPNCGQTKWKPKYLDAGMNEDCRNIYNESRIDHTCLCPYKIMSFGPYFHSSYFKTSCRYATIMIFENFEIKQSYTKPSNEFGVVDISPQGIRSQIDFFSDQKFTGSHLRLDLTGNCSNLPTDLWKGYEVRSVNAKWCVILYSEHSCRGRSIKLRTGKSSNLNIKWKNTFIDFSTFLVPLLYFKNWQWDTKSFHACKYYEGGPTLNIDITPYFPDKEQSSHDIILYSYKNVTSCQNVPQDIYTMDEWSTNNHGNGFLAYFEPNCQKSKTYEPVWIPPGRNSFSMGIGSLKRTNNITGQVFKIKSFSSINFTTTAYDKVMGNIASSTTEAEIHKNVTETLPKYNKISNEHVDEQIKLGTSMWTYIGISVGVLFALIFSAILGIHWVRLSRMQNLLSPDEVKQFLIGNYKNTRKDSQNDIHADQTTTERNALEKPYDSSLEIAKKNFEILWSSPLGSGEFGSVYKAFVTLAASNEKIQVALKMTKDNCPKSAMMSILGEIKILSYLGQHPNLVCVKGAYTAEISKGVVYVATEICELGSIKDYLKNKEMVENSRGRGNVYENSSSSVDFGTMVRWSYEIASGMEYLDEKHVIHADLAARNVLLTADKTAKISDFGLSRRLYEYTNYVKRNQEPLPWRWMAVEALKKLEFSSQSDVWSYGVTLWEIFSMGDIPFPGHSWTMDFLSSLESGLRMKCPPHATPEIYKLMTSCWQNFPQDRPTFSELRQKFAGMQEKREETRRIRARYAMSCM